MKHEADCRCRKCLAGISIQTFDLTYYQKIHQERLDASPRLRHVDESNADYRWYCSTRHEQIKGFTQLIELQVRLIFGADEQDRLKIRRLYGKYSKGCRRKNETRKRLQV